MRMVDLITQKKQGGALSDAQIRFLVEGYTAGELPDYQVSALLMAICFVGLTQEEIFALTHAMAESGESVDLHALDGISVDKHSTGGVGDKTTLILGPLAAACGVKVAKMSGRGLGFTGGTADKLESIPGLCLDLPQARMVEIANRCGLCLVTQSGNLTPADKKLYALRDVTGTVDSMGLIASSIMSKKLAASCDCIVLDVKVGSGAFMKTLDEAIELAQLMVEIGRRAGRPTQALITDMDSPLGAAVGNALEVQEAIDTLHGGGPDDLRALCLALSTAMLMAAGLGDEATCRARCEQALCDGSAAQVLRDMIALQGGEAGVVDDPSLLPQARHSLILPAPQDGYVRHLNAEQCGVAAMLTGAGRTRKEEALDYGAGLLLHKKAGEAVTAGEPLATLFSNDENKLRQGMDALAAAYAFCDTPPAATPLLLARVDETGVTRL